MTAATGGVTIPPPSVRIEPACLTPGAPARLTITLDVPDGCHIQAHAPRDPFLIPTVLEIDAVGDVNVGPPVYPAPVVERFEWTPVELDVYRGRVDIEVPIDAGVLAADRITITGRLLYQACTSTACLPPIEHAIAAEVRLQGPEEPGASERGAQGPRSR